jgi:hypothetical protein
MTVELRRRLVVAALLVAGLILSSSSPAAGSASSSGDGSGWSSAAGPSATNPLLSQESVFAAFEHAATEQGAIGFFTDDRTKEFIVVVPVSRMATFTMPTLTVPDVSVRVQQLDVDPDQITAAISRLDDVAPELTANGDSLRYGFNAKLGKVDAAGTIESAKLLSLLGDLAKVVEYRSGVTVNPASRHSTNAPFPGGAQAKRVGSGNSYDCTTGFTVRKPVDGRNYLVSAGHCGLLGTDWISPGTGSDMGTFWYRQFGPRDIALIGNKTYDPAILTGDATGVRSVVKGASDPVVGRSIYCYSGAATLDQCTVTVVSLEDSACYNGVCLSHLMSFQQLGSCPAMHGDSGAPFYLDFAFGGYPYIRGMVTAFDPSVCDGEKWSLISGTYGLTIVTG